MPLKKKTKNVLLFLARTGLSVALLTYLFRQIDIGAMSNALKNANYMYIFLAGAIFFMINFAMLFRWMLLIKGVKLSVPLKSIVKYFFIGLFFNLFLPTSTGGDIVKAIGLFRDTDEKAKVVASVLCDRLAGFIGIVIVAVIAFLFGWSIVQDTAVLVSIAVLATVSLSIVLFLFNARLFAFWCRIFNKVPGIKAKFMKLHDAIALLKGNIRYMFFAIGISCTTQIVLAFTFYLVAKGLHQDIRFVYFLIFVPIICVVSALPSIGGLGVRDAGAAYYFTKVGVESTMAVSISLINFSFMVFVGLVGGIIYVIALTPTQRRNYQSDTKGADGV